MPATAERADDVSVAVLEAAQEGYSAFAAASDGTGPKLHKIREEEEQNAAWYIAVRQTTP